MRHKLIHGFQTGDLVQAQVLRGKKPESMSGGLRCAIVAPLTYKRPRGLSKAFRIAIATFCNGPMAISFNPKQ